MFCSRTASNLIDKIHERSLRICHPNITNSSSLRELLNASGDICIHQKHLQQLAKEVYKFLHDQSPPFMSDIFKTRVTPYPLRNQNPFSQITPSTMRYGFSSISYRAGQIWVQVPEKAKSAVSYLSFKSQIKNWICHSCPCNICKTYIHGLGYL